MTTAEMTTLRRDPLPMAFRVWVCGALASQLGDSAMYFALGGPTIRRLAGPG